MSKTDPLSIAGDLRELMAWSMAALLNHRISKKDAEDIARLGHAYEQLQAYRASYTERAHREMPAVGEVPSIARLKPYIDADDFPAAIAEARKIRDAMKPILQHAKSQLDTTRK